MEVVAAVVGLASLPRDTRAAVAGVHPIETAAAGLPARLRELGFVDGEEVRVLTRGLRGGPLAVRIGGSTFALRVAEAECVLVRRPPA